LKPVPAAQAAQKCEGTVQYTVSLNALASEVKADLLIEIKLCAWCRDQFVSAAAHQQFCKPVCRKTAFRNKDDGGG
jgi:hypothetical protein